MRFPLTLTCVLIALGGLISCEDTDVSSTTRRIEVVAVNYPLAFFAERIGRDHVEVLMPVPSGVDPADWEPTPEEIGQIQQANLILLNGAKYATWATTTSLPSSRTWTTSNNERDDWIRIQNGEVHSHGPGGGHSHMTTASTTWLDPEIAIAQADSVRSALVEFAPEFQEEFGSNFRVLRRQIIEAAADVEQAINTHPKQPVLFSHPVYQYLARRFGMNSRNVHWEPNHMPDEAEWTALAALLENHPAKWMIWEAQPDPEIAQRLRTLGIESVVYSPCGATPESGDYLDSISDGATALRKVYGAEGSG